MIIMFIIAIILLITGTFALLIISEESSSKLSPIAILFILCLSIGGILLHESNIHKRPQAIDVYRNNTELIITESVKNGVVVDCDTTVIFKK